MKHLNGYLAPYPDQLIDQGIPSSDGGNELFAISTIFLEVKGDLLLHFLENFSFLTSFTEVRGTTHSLVYQQYT